MLQEITSVSDENKKLKKEKEDLEQRLADTEKNYSESQADLENSIVRLNTTKEAYERELSQCRARIAELEKEVRVHVHCTHMYFRGTKPMQKQLTCTI